VRLHGVLAEHVAARGLSALVSVSDEKDMASATVLLQRKDPADA
jgi:phosphopantetheinyl transferase (holo-ACP synthase)